MTLALVIGTPGIAQEGPQLLIAPKIIGLDIGAGFTPFSLVPDLDTVTWLVAGAAWQGRGYYRNTDGSLFTGDPETASYDRLRFNWRLGLQQQLAAPPDGSIAGLSAQLWYIGSWMSRFADSGSTIESAPLPDAEASQINRLLAAISFDAVESSADGLQNGGSVEVSAEYGPGFVNFVGGADYLRLNLTTTAYVPVWTLYSNEQRLMSLTLAAFSSIDSAFGSSIPIEVRQSFGGLSPRDGLGGAVRGIRGTRFGVANKLVANVETRFDLPAIEIPGLGSIRPGILSFLDAGTYSDELTVPSPVAGSEVSIGTAVYVDVLRIATLAFYTSFWVTGDRLGDQGQWNPFALGFGLHF